MKTMYIPKGETVTYETVETEHLVIRGCMKVSGDVKAEKITGSGVLQCAGVTADTICLDEVEASVIICKRLLAKRVMTPELFASESAAVSCYLSASYVETGKLTVAISELGEVKADEVVHLRRKKRKLIGTLLASRLRSFWTSLTASPIRAEESAAEETAADEEVSGTEEEAECSDTEAAPLSKAAIQLNALGDPELTRVVTMFELLRKSGYTLKIIPGTPEENAAAYDFTARMAA